MLGLKENKTSDMFTTSLLDIVQFEPNRLAPGAWIGHIPFAVWMIKQIKPPAKTKINR